MNEINEYKNIIYTGKIKKLSEKGWGIIESELGKVNIHYTIPDEIVRYELVEEQYGELWGKILSIEKNSRFRIKPKCKHYGVCGGCNLMHIEYEKQIELKADKFVSAIEKKLGRKIKIDKIYKKNPFNYRVKAKLKGIEKSGKIGFIKKGKTEVMEITECLLFHNKLNDFIKIWNNLSSPPFIHQIDIFYNIRDDKTYVFLSHKPNDTEFTKIFGENTVFIYPSKEISTVSIKIGGYNYLLLPQIFFQVNYLMWETLLSSVDKNIKKYYANNGNQLAIDLYSGVGFFTPVLKKYFKTVIGVESSVLSVELSKKNFPDIKFIRTTADKFSFPKGELIFIDPPRSGLNKKVSEKIIKTGYDKIFYLSCSYLSLAESLLFFEEKGYRLEYIEIFDMFPHPPYLETLVILVKK